MTHAASRRASPDGERRPSLRRALLGAALALALVPSVAGADATSAPVRHVRVGDVDLAYRLIAALLGLLFPLPAEQAASDAYIASITRWSEFSLSVPSDVLSAQLAASAQWFAHGPSLKPINVPTLVGGGLEDQLIPPANQRRLAARIKGAKLVLYPGAAHGFLAQDWRSFGARVERFFG